MQKWCEIHRKGKEIARSTGMEGITEKREERRGKENITN